MEAKYACREHQEQIPILWVTKLLDSGHPRTPDFCPEYRGMKSENQFPCIPLAPDKSQNPRVSANKYGPGQPPGPYRRWMSRLPFFHRRGDEACASRSAFPAHSADHDSADPGSRNEDPSTRIPLLMTCSDGVSRRPSPALPRRTRRRRPATPGYSERARGASLNPQQFTLENCRKPSALPPSPAGSKTSHACSVSTLRDS